MAQVGTVKRMARQVPMEVMQYSNLLVAVPAAGNTTIAEFGCQSCHRVFVTLVLTLFPLDAFIINARSQPDAPYQTLFNSAADFTGPGGILIGASGDLTTLAVGQGWFIMETLGIDSIQLQASANGGQAALTVYGGGS